MCQTIPGADELVGKLLTSFYVPRLHWLDSHLMYGCLPRVAGVP